MTGKYSAAPAEQCASRTLYRFAACLRKGLAIAFPMAACLTASAAWADLASVTKAFSPGSIAVGTPSTLTITIVNGNENSNGIAFTDSYPANLLNAASPNAVNTCDGTVTAVGGGASLSLVNGKLKKNESCTVSVSVTSSMADSYLNSTGIVSTKNDGSIGPASATLSVTAAPPAVAKSFTPNSIAAGGTSTLAVTLTNSNAVAATGVAFTDAYPSAALTNASPTGLSNSCGGTATAAAGASSLSLSGGTIAANSSCTVSVTVTSTVVGSYLNSTGIVTTTNAGTGTAATATLTVASASAAPSGFNAFETGTAAGSVSGVIKTKIAASAFGLDIVALKSSGTAVETAFAGDVKLELVDASAGASCGAYALIRNLGTLTFTAADLGRKTLAGISEPNAWPNARIRMTYPATGAPTITACSTDNFAIRPASFGGVMVSDASSTTAGIARMLTNTAASGGNVHKAGRPFRIAATAYNATGVATPNYTGNPAASLTVCVLPVSGCTLGALSTGAWSTVSGTVATDGASYSEVGAFAMKLADADFAAVDVDDSSAAEMTIESAAVNVGRFVPDHFELATASTPVFVTFNDTTCATRSFTYVGQPFGYLTLPQATITAKNAAGATTTNYAGVLWKLAAADATQTYADADVARTLDTGLVGTPVLTETGGGAGTLKANAADVVAYVRTTPVAPFMSAITLSMSVRDSTENGEPGNGFIDTVTPAQFSNIAFDVVPGNEIRFGRLVLSNAHGSELLDLPVPIETQYWNGNGFARNTADSCTQFNATDVSLSNWRRDLNVGDTAVSLSGRFDAGRGKLKLSKPGEGNTGSVDLALQLGAASQIWLQGRWTGGAYDQDPTARASFGLYRGSKSLIYLREMH